jgi:hypothetical protein
MGKALVPVGQSDTTIVRRIVRDTVDQLIEKTNFPDATLIFNDESVDSPRNLKNMFDGCYDDGGIRTQYKNYVFIEYEDVTTEQGWINSLRTNKKTPSIFHDKEAGIDIYPHYLQHENTITMKFRCNDKSRMDAWLNGLRATDAIRLHLGYIDIGYDYNIPDIYLAFLYAAWENKSKLPGYDKDLKEYLNSWKSEAFQTRKNLNGTYTQAIAHEAQQNVEGQPEDAMFWNTREIQRGIYEVTLVYKFTYKRATALVMNFPALIYNRFIPSKFVKLLHSNFRLRDDYEYDRPIDFIDNDLRKHEIEYYYRGDGGSRMVPWDDWFPKEPVKETQTVTLFPVNVDLSNLHDVCNLNDVPDKYLPAGYKAYAASEWQTINLQGTGLLRIEMYEVGETENFNFIKVDQDLNMTTSRPMDPTKRNYLRIGLARDITDIHPDSLRRLLEKPDDAMQIFKLYDSTVELIDDASEWEERVGYDMEPGRDKSIPSLLLLSCDSITDYSFTRWARKLDDTAGWFVNLQSRRMRTVGQYNISARR